MTMLVCGLALFLGVHSISIIAPKWRNRSAARIGERTFQGIYSLASVLGFVLILWGYPLARQDPIVLFVPPVGLRHLAITLMVPVFALLIAAYLPSRIRRATAHPMLLAIILWSLAHLLANGMLADLVLFGSFLCWSILDRLSMQWRESNATPSAPPGKYNDLIALIGGLALYLVFLLWAHRWLLGTPLVQ